MVQRIQSELFDGLLEALRADGLPFRFCTVVLDCGEQKNIARMKRDGYSSVISCMRNNGSVDTESI